MAGTKLATAYVQIIPTTSGLNNALKKEIEPGASSVGESSGALFSTNFLKKIASAAITIKIAGAIKDGISKGIEEGAALQQSRGGVETLFKEDADKLKANANEAYKTAGVSANEYMEQVTSFSASLIKSLGGNTEAAAETANMAMIDMADNANKFGTDIQRVQDAYQSFARQQYTLLDNLKLGYGGTKTEMERLLADAKKLTGIEYDITNLNDVFQAIHAIQEELGVTGTTAVEAEKTYTGSLAAMLAASKNLMAKMTLGEDVSEEMDALGETVGTFLNDNLMPMLVNFLNGAADKLPEFMLKITNILIDHAPELANAGLRLGAALLQGLGESVEAAVNSNKLLKFLFDPIGLLIDSTYGPEYALNIHSGIEGQRQKRAEIAEKANITNYNFNVDADSLSSVKTLEDTAKSAQRIERMGKG